MNCTKAFDTLHVATCILFFKYQNKCNETSICYPKKDLKVYLRYFINNRNLFIYFVAINLLVMAEDIESYKLTYFWKGCDHLMGFKEFVDIRRTETETFLEVSNRGNLFERKFIGSIGDGIVFQRGDIDDFFIFRNMCVLSNEAVWNPSFENRMVLLAEYTSPGYCMLRYIAGPVFSKISTASLKPHVYIYPVLNFWTSALPFQLGLPALLDLSWSRVVKDPPAPFLSSAGHRSPRIGLKEIENDVGRIKKHYLKLYEKDVIVFQLVRGHQVKEIWNGN